MRHLKRAEVMFLRRRTCLSLNKLLLLLILVRLWVYKSRLLEHRLYNRIEIGVEKLKDNEGGPYG